MRIVILNLIFLISIQTNIMGQIYNYEDNTESKGFWKSTVIQARSSTSFFDIKGPGIINKLWLTTFPSNETQDMELANNLIINMYWDNSKEAAVSVPIADFFCQPLKLQAIENHFFNSTNNQLLFDTNIPMPFRQNARFELINNSNKEVELFYGIDVEFKAIDIAGGQTIEVRAIGQDDEGYALRHAPPLFGSTTLTLEQNSLRLALSAVYNTEVSHENLAPTERDKTYIYAIDENGDTYSPAWWTLNLKGSYAFYQDTFTITLGVENILNHRYRPYSSGIAGSGRNFIAAFLYRF